MQNRTKDKNEHLFGDGVGVSAGRVHDVDAELAGGLGVDGVDLIDFVNDVSLNNETYLRYMCQKMVDSL